MIDAYIALKWAHILGACILLGAGAAIAWFQLVSWRSGDVAAIAAVSDLVVKADWTFTLTAGLFQPLTGAALIWHVGWDPLEPWLLAAYGLYALIFACWAPVVWLQIQTRDLARAAHGAGAPLPAAHGRLMRIWFILGWPAFLAMLVLVWLMIARPSF